MEPTRLVLVIVAKQECDSNATVALHLRRSLKVFIVVELLLIHEIATAY
jgi:hypothetical protein